MANMHYFYNFLAARRLSSEPEDDLLLLIHELPQRCVLGNSPGVPCTGYQQHDAFVLRCFRRGRTKTRRWVLLTSSTAGSRFFNRGPATNGCRPCRTPSEG